MSTPSFDAVVIGASAGAISALSVLLPALPEKYPLPILIVVHLPADKDSVIAELFQGKCPLRVKEAEDKEALMPGTIYFAPPDYHLLVEKNNTLSLSSEEPVLFSRPSIDILFESAADAFGAKLLGIVLTGASEDGAAGMHAVCAHGGVALVEDPATAYATAMPRAALAACASAQKLSLAHIAAYLQKVSP